MVFSSREASNDDYLKLRLFPSSLTGQAFTWEDMQNLFQSHFSRTDPGVSITDLARIRQQVGETTEQYIMKFKRAKVRYQVNIPESSFFKLAQDGLNFELRKKFEGMVFNDLFFLSERATRYENMLREESHRRSTFYGTSYQEPVTVDVDVAEYVKGNSLVCNILVKKERCSGTEVLEDK